MKDRGDAISDRLPVAVDQGYVDGKSTRDAASFAARTHRHADRRFQQYQQVAGIDTERSVPVPDSTALILPPAICSEVSRISPRAEPGRLRWICRSR